MIRRGTCAAIALVASVAVMTGCAAEPDPSSSARPSPSSSASASASERPSPSATPSPSPTPVVPSFDKTRLSIDDPTSLWVVVDKLRPLNPVDYVPPDLVETPVSHQNSSILRAETSAAMVAMFAAAKAEGAGDMTLQSSYRSYSTQVSVHDNLVATLGMAQADAQSARPGFSEHQTGLTADISALPLTCVLQACFGQTPQGQWLAANSWRFGFIIRYPSDKTPVTGYIYEPWHVRYLGPELAAEMHTTGVTTLEEFFGLPAAPDYAP